MVGNRLYALKIDLTASIILDNSPPEATLSKVPKFEPLFAEK